MIHALIGALPLLALSLVASGAELPKQRILCLGGLLHFDLLIADANGQNQHRFLPDSGSNYNASFSADGRWIVFTSERSGQAEVYRAHPDGSGIERLTEHAAFDDQGALSPDNE